MADEKYLNEFRQDLVSGDWVLFSTGRKHSIRKFEIMHQPKNECPFENLKESQQEIISQYPDEENPTVTIIKNKFPAVISGICGPDRLEGPVSVHDATGIHEVIVYKDHDRHFSDFSVDQMTDTVRVYKKRYQEIALEKSNCTSYIMIFHNYGQEAGASISHPHSQIISTPILPPDISRSIRGSYKFYKENKKRVYDVLVNWEREEKKRIVYENDIFIAFCPFFSKNPYEVRIFAKDGHAHFEKMPDELDKYLADALVNVLKKIKTVLNDPPFNFFIHTAPTEAQWDKVNFHEFYHWHIEILPKLSIMAGFELGTGIDINVVDPDQAAEELRNA